MHTLQVKSLLVRQNDNGENVILPIVYNTNIDELKKHCKRGCYKDLAKIHLTNAKNLAFKSDELNLLDSITNELNDLSVSRTVKEVLDTLCLIKQIDNRTLKDYEYSLEEVSDKYYPLKEYKDPDERYYACVVDKNRAGSKPKVLFNLNLAYNRWVEVGYLRLKEQK